MKIEGEPTFKTLHSLLQLLKVNTGYMPCTLGGGIYGYVGMLVSGISNAILTPFTAPVHPGSLKPVAGATQF